LKWAFDTAAPLSQRHRLRDRTAKSSAGGCSNRERSGGGIWAWRDVIFAAMRLQSLNALGQAGLLTGAERIIRLDAPANERKIQIDDWTRARAMLPGAAEAALDEFGMTIAETFLNEPAEVYTPLIGCSTA
jgi:uncharacterized protein